MRAISLAIFLFFLSTAASGAIYKCEKGGKTTYQSVPCPVGATEQDASHLEHSQRMFTSGNRYRNYSEQDAYNEARQLQQRREFEYNRKIKLNEKKRQRRETVRQAERLRAEEKRAKAERDRRWREDKIRRKARNSGNYDYLDINIR